MHGDGVDGAPLDNYEPACGAADGAGGTYVDDCWRACGADDVLAGGAGAELLDVFSEAAAWAGKVRRCKLTLLNPRSKPWN